MEELHRTARRHHTLWSLTISFRSALKAMAVNDHHTSFLLPLWAVPVVAFGGTVAAAGLAVCVGLLGSNELGWIFFLLPFGWAIGIGIGLLVAGAAMFLRVRSRDPDRRMAITMVYLAGTTIVLCLLWAALSSWTWWISAIVFSALSAGISAAAATLPRPVHKPS